MRLLIKLNQEQQLLLTNPVELAKSLFETASVFYNEDCDVPDAYLQKPESSEDIVDELDLLTGKDDPQAIIDLANGWNLQLAKDLETALAAALTQQTGDGAERWLTVQSNQIYNLKKAIMALDNDFYAFSEYALLVNAGPYETGYITNRLQPGELQGILAHPEKYAVITVEPK